MKAGMLMLLVSMIFSVGTTELYAEELYADIEQILDVDDSDIIAEAKKLMPNEDWNRIDALNDGEKIIEVRSLLAMKAYESLRAEFVTDLKNQIAKRNDTVWEYSDDYMTVYQRESAKKYFEDMYKGKEADIHCEKVCWMEDVRYNQMFAAEYVSGCKKPDEICLNVTQIPDEWEEISLSESCSSSDSRICRMAYTTDSAQDNKQVVQTVALLVDVNNNVKSVRLSVEKMTKKLSEDRSFENAYRRDVKDGKLADSLRNDGFYTNDWSPIDAGGYVKGRRFNYSMTKGN